jgi:hypothetical protein
MVQRLIISVAIWLIWPASAWALSPYVMGDKIVCAGVAACIQRTEQRLQGAGFRLVGVHIPRGIPGYAVLVVTDKNLLEIIRALGGSAIVGAGIRVGVKGDGTVSYINPDYWYRAYFQKKFESRSASIQALRQRLAKALGEQAEFGGDVPAIELPTYRYMLGMERFDSQKDKLYTHANFRTALNTVQENLAHGMNHTKKVYEVIFPDQKMAVFGVAMNDPKRGERWWVKQAGVENIAALPWEIYIVNGQVYALYARYRTALAWPDLTMGVFMRITDHPESVREMLTGIAGGKYHQGNEF